MVSDVHSNSYLTNLVHYRWPISFFGFVWLVGWFNRCLAREVALICVLHLRYNINYYYHSCAVVLLRLHTKTNYVNEKNAQTLVMVPICWRKFTTVGYFLWDLVSGFVLILWQNTSVCFCEHGTGTFRLVPVHLKDFAFYLFLPIGTPTMIRFFAY